MRKKIGSKTVFFLIFSLHTTYDILHTSPVWAADETKNADPKSTPADMPEPPALPVEMPQPGKMPPLPENAREEEDPMDQWVEHQGGKIETDKNKIRAPALEMQKTKPAKQTRAQEPPILYADPSLKKHEKQIKEKVPARHERGSAKEKEFFEKNNLDLETGHLSKEKLHGAPRPDKPDEDKNGPETKMEIPAEDKKIPQEPKQDAANPAAQKIKPSPAAPPPPQAQENSLQSGQNSPSNSGGGKSSAKTPAGGNKKKP